VRQHRCVPGGAARDLNCSDFQRLLVDTDVDLAPDASFRATMFAGVPLTFPFYLDPCAVDKQVQWALRARYGMITASVLWRRQMVLKSGTTQSSPVSRSRLSTKPVIWRSAIPKSTFLVRHAWMAASLNVRDLPLLPEGSASQFISGSNQIVSDPRRFSAAL
jgi:hypothetical protein